MTAKALDALPTSCPTEISSAETPSAQHKLPTQNYRASKEQLLSETSEEVRNILRYELNSAISHFIQRDQPVYLEGLGILFSEIHNEQRSEATDGAYYVWSETFRTVIFEKCYDLIALHREKFADIAETRELVQWIYPRLPLYITSKWAERDVRRLLRAVIESIKQQVVTDGHSAQLTCVGDLFALHNRQGRAAAEWYAGADIFLHSSWNQIISASRKRAFERPELKSAWELFEAAYGPALATFDIFLPKELRDMGYDPSLLPTDHDPHIRVAAFRNVAEGESNGTYIFCTDGLRKLGILSKRSKGFGNEIVFQLSQKGADAFVHGANEAPIDVARRPITAAWMLLQSAPSRTLRSGAGLSVGAPLYGPSFNAPKSGAPRCTVSTIFATPLQLVRGQQVSTEGLFCYINIIGIADDEAAIASKYSPEYLLSLLEHRKLTQVSSLSRPSLLARTELSHTLGKRPPGAPSNFMRELPGDGDLIATAS